MPTAAEFRESEEVVRECFGEILAFADELFQFGCKMGDGRVVPKQSMDKAFYNASIALHVRSCRVFMAGVSLARKALAAEADVLARTLLETAITQAFVSRDKFELLNSKGMPAAVPSAAPDRRLRDRLYLAHSDIRAMDWKAESLGSALTKNELELLEFWRNEIGDAWLKAIRYSNTPAGVSITALAKSAGGNLAAQFRSSYGYHCGLSHPSMAYRYSEPIAGAAGVVAKWNDGRKETAVCLANLMQFFLLNLEEFLEPYNSGLESEYQEFDAQFETVFQTLQAIAAADKD